ncbi:hypothetical protein GQ42DRAFT_164794 [Ramicandelaber brevisporus]|nr:hypothetical protein GQ42DRAFT_164794 [Ramicandelaber brevisporus]
MDATITDSELRARLRRDIDAASDEQLRQIALFLANLGCSSDGISTNRSDGFRFFDLPYELCEYTAESYFNTPDAASLLPVSRSFHKLFTSKLWRSLPFNGVMYSGPMTSRSLMRNGKMVRHLRLGSLLHEFHLTGYFPHVQHVLFEINSGMIEMFEVHLELMSYLRRVTLSITHDSSGAEEAACRWINEVSRDQHAPLIWLKIERSEYEWQSALGPFEAVMNGIQEFGQVRIDLAVSQPLSDATVAKLPQSLVSLSTVSELNNRCCGEMNKQLFGSDNSNSTFPHLRKLQMPVCCSNRAIYNYSTFTPERFPKLQSLSLAVTSSACNELSQQTLATIFARQWETVVEFSLSAAAKISVPDIHGYLVNMPNIQKCSLTALLDVDFGLVAQAIPFVQALSIASCASTASSTTTTTAAATNRNSCLRFLQSLNVDEMTFDTDTFPHMMAAAPRLATVELKTCSIAKDVADQLHGIKALSVKTLRLKEVFANYDTKIDPIIEMFPNVQVLDIQELGEYRKLEVLRLYCKDNILI